MTINRRTFTTTSIAAGAAATTAHLAGAQATPQATPAGNDLAVRIQEVLDRYGVPGAVIGIMDSTAPDGIFYGAGLADVATGEPVSTDMHFRIASITKTFVATIVLQLVDEERLSLEDTLATVLPDLDIVNNDQITVRHLLGMRSGLPHIESTPAFVDALVADSAREYSLEELYSYTNDVPAQADPDTALDYNNLNYNILGDIIEQVTGNAWDEELQTRIIEPLGLGNTSYPHTVEMPAPYARGYGYLDQDMSDVIGTPDAMAATPVDETAQATPVAGDVQPLDESGIYDLTEFHPSIAGAAGGMVSTIKDMLVWARAFANGELVSQEMFTQQVDVVPMDNTGQVGYGLGILNVAGLLGHNGAINGYQSVIVSAPQFDVTFAVLTNCHPTIGWADVAFELVATLLNS